MGNLALILDTYSLEEILAYNDMTVEDLLTMLVDEELIKLPEEKPVDYDDRS